MKSGKIVTLVWFDVCKHLSLDVGHMQTFNINLLLPAKIINPSVKKKSIRK
jgi:hypothetical protein